MCCVCVGRCFCFVFFCVFDGVFVCCCVACLLNCSSVRLYVRVGRCFFLRKVGVVVADGVFV